MSFLGLFGSAKKVDGGSVVLLVEDEEENRLLAQTLLGQLGVDVISAENGSQGLALARSKLPKLILLDIVMPVMDGLQMLEKLKADPKTKTIPVIILSSRERDAQQALRMGADGYLNKPYDNDAFLDRVRNALGLPKI